MISLTIFRPACILALISMFQGSAQAETASALTNTITVDTRGATPTVLSYAGFSYEDNGTTITITGFTTAGNSKNLYIPSSIAGKPVTAIADGAFAGSGSLKSITLPSGLTNLGSNAFSGSAKLETATFQGNAPTAVGSDAFSGTAGDFKVLYYGTSNGFSSPTWQGYPSQDLVTSSDVFDNVSLSMNERQGLMEISFDYFSATLTGSPGKGNVSAEYFLGGESEWREMKSVSGAIGSQISAGRGVKITWNYAADAILTDPALDASISVRLVSNAIDATAVETSIPVPALSPSLPVTVNLCFGYDSPISYPLLKSGESLFSNTPSPASNNISAAEIELIRLETMNIYRRAGITPSSMIFLVGAPQPFSSERHIINVYFTSKIPSSKIIGTYGKGVSIRPDGRPTIDRFRQRFPQGIVLVATEPAIRFIFREYLYPKNIAELIAHEIGHALGLRHMKELSIPNTSVMDYNWLFDKNTNSYSNFSSEALPLTLNPEEGLAGETQNEVFYLQRWVEGIRKPNGLVHGSFDLPVASPGDPEKNVSVDISTGAAAAGTFYNVRILEMAPDGESGSILREFPTLAPEQILNFKTNTRHQIRIIASSVPDGEADLVITPQSQAEVESFTPVEGEALKVLQFDDSGNSIVIGSGMTGEVTFSPIMPETLSVKPVGFDGSHVQIDFPAEAGYLYTVERSEDCSTWTAVPELTKIPGSSTAPLCLIHDNGGNEDGSVFYRLLVEIPPAP